MKKLIPVVLCSMLFFSCASVHVPIVGETAVKRNNIYIEYMAIGDGYFDQAKYDNAIKYYKLSTQNKKLYWAGQYKIGRAYALSKNWDEAKKVYSKLNKRDPENISIQMSLAYINAMAGDLESAESIYEVMWKNNPENVDVIVNYIDVLIAGKKYELAEKYLSELKEKFHENSNISAFEKKLEEVQEKTEQEKTSSSS